MGKMQAVQEIINVFVASVVSLAVLFILTRLGGKRQIAQMNLFDYVNSITIGSIAAEMATNLEQWYRPLTAMIVYGIAAFAVHYGTCKNRNVRLWLSGQAIPLMENGTIYKAELGRAKIDLNDPKVSTARSPRRTLPSRQIRPASGMTWCWMAS